MVSLPIKLDCELKFFLSPSSFSFSFPLLGDLGGGEEEEEEGRREAVSLSDGSSH